jgi:anti-sigma regulatory factor (Ser/Thr protein kinase)
MGASTSTAGTLAPDWSHHAAWAGDPASVPMARRFVTDRLTEHGETAVLDAARLVVSELVTNVVRHARTEVVVALMRVGDRVLLRVGDTASARPRVRHVDADSDTGRGLAIVAMMSSDWGVSDDAGIGKWVWAAFDGDDGR